VLKQTLLFHRICQEETYGKKYTGESNNADDGARYLHDVVDQAEAPGLAMGHP